MPRVPEQLKGFFWDVDVKELDIEKHKVYIIERLLDFGSEAAYRWLFATYTDTDIMAVIRRSKRISRPTALMMANFYSIPKEEVWCLSHASTRTF